MAFSFHVPRPVRAAVALLVLAGLVGATYQGVTTSLERRRFPHPGRLVDIGGHQLHIYCTGKGAPTVVLSAPASGLSASWARVQPDLSKLTRVCSYDRSGLGWSERGDDPYDPTQTPSELRALLVQADEHPPFIVAGDGLGAAFARAFATRFPDVTAALVLFDAPHIDRRSSDANSLGRMPNAMPWLARVGLLRTGLGPAPTPNLPELRAFMNRPDHLTRAALEIARWDDALRLSSDAAVPSPTAVVDAALPGPLTSDIGATAARTVLAQTIRATRSGRSAAR